MIPITITVHKDGGDIVFSPHDTQSISYVQSVSFSGDEIQSDEMSAIVRVQSGTAEFLSRWNGVNRQSAVWLVGQTLGGRTEKYYFKSLRRVGKDLYQIDAQSPLARLTADFHGDVYAAKPLPDVIADIIGGAVPYECNPLLGAVRVHGWAPYQSRRESLHAAALAYGFLIRRNANFDLYFTVPDSDAFPIPENNIFTGGSVAYSVGDTYYQAQITARDYRQSPDAATQTLFDNSGSVPAERLIVKFDKPMFDIAADGGLEIVESGVNYAIVSGVGALTGKPYAEYTSAVTVDGDPDADPEHIISVSDAPLITSLNAVSVGERLLSFYNADATVNADILRTLQKPGDCVTFNDPFGDARTGYITALSGSITSIDRASAAIVCGYTPSWGAAYDAVDILTGSGVWTAPATLDGKTVRVVLIGGGQGGASGQHGTDAAAAGSGRGLPGSGGNILDVKITVAAGQTFPYSAGGGGAAGIPTDATSAERPDSPPHYVSNPGQLGSASAFGGYSTDEPKAKPADAGFYDIIDGNLYATPGPDYGVDGGQATAATENGDRNAPAYVDVERVPVAVVSPPWDAAQSWISGNVGAGGSHSTTQQDYTEWAYGGIGGGAAFGADGADGANVRVDTSADIGGRGGDGADASAAFPDFRRAFGSGGSGGHGGGEGGKGGSGHTTDGDGINGADGSGGSGSAGQDGADGCILIYYKKADNQQWHFSVRDGNLVLTYYTAAPPPFHLDENGHLRYRVEEGETQPNYVIRNGRLYLQE